MYYIIDSETGNRHPCAVAPRATIRNLREVFSMLDKGAEPCVAHVVFPTGETLDVKVPLRYRLNSLGRKTVIIGGNLLFQKRLEIDIEHLARFQWGEAHKWDQGTMGIWWEAAGITDTSKPVDDETIERLHEAFPKTSLRGIVDRYRAQHYGHPTPSIYTLIDLALKANRPLTDQRPSKSGIAIEFKDNEYGRMGIARDKRTGQTWMWPPEEENDANEEFGVAPDDKADAFVSYRTVDGRRKTIKEMIEDIDDAEKLTEFITGLTGITDHMLQGMPTAGAAMMRFHQWIDHVWPAGEPLTIIAHNAQFDVSFLDAAERVYDPTSPVFDCKWACTKEMSWELNPQKRHHRVADLIVDYHIGDVEEHRALSDAIQEQMLYQALCAEATRRGKWNERED